MTKKIITDEEHLKKKSIDFDFDGDLKLENVIKDLIATVQAPRKDMRGVGLAGNQIGYGVRVFVMAKAPKGFMPVVNPKVISRSGGVKAVFESCLSRPGKPPVKVRRDRRIFIEYYDVESKAVVKRWFKGLQSQIVQHEMDHFDGKLI